MNQEELNVYLRSQAEAFPGQCSFLVADSLESEPLHLYQPDVSLPAASTIKTPILLTALEQVRQGMLGLSDRLEIPSDAVLPGTQVFDREEHTYSVEELLYWMIAQDDNTAANILLDALGFDAVNEYCTIALGLKNTLCQRKLLDGDSPEAGPDNVTSAADQRRLFCLLQGGCILNPGLRRLAMSILSRQRHQDCILRYISDEVLFAHKTGLGDRAVHDCGLFFFLHARLFVGIFTWDGACPDGIDGQKRFIGRQAKAIYDTYREE